MLLDQWMMSGLNILLVALLFIFAFAASYFLLQWMPARRRRWVLGHVKNMLRPKKAYPVAGKLLFIRSGSDRLREKQQMLHGCGWKVDGFLYEIGRRLSIAFSLCALFAMWIPSVREWLDAAFSAVYVACGCLILLVALFCDRAILGALKHHRTNRIVGEIYAVSNQLLYYAESRLNLHAKLSRCVPYTRYIRDDFRKMLAEWYQDADESIRTFKNRMGTNEAHSFAETLNALRLNQHDRYYDLMRQRINDYKEKLELIRESRKETSSYILFALAGIPILYTFRLFIYPWVLEGQKLFDSLN